MKDNKWMYKTSPRETVFMALLNPHIGPYVICTKWRNGQFLELQDNK